MPLIKHVKIFNWEQAYMLLVFEKLFDGLEIVTVKVDKKLRAEVTREELNGRRGSTVVTDLRNLYRGHGGWKGGRLLGCFLWSLEGWSL
jgi:hypothetical protein